MSDRGALSGVTVVDLSELVPGPNATRLLAGPGADVIKVERPGDDRLRQRQAMFSSQNRGKRSIVIDLKTEAGRNTLKTVVRSADVFVGSYRPDVLDRLGSGAIPRPEPDFSDRYIPTSLPIADMSTAIYAILAITLAAVQKRQAPDTFRGAHIDVAMADCALALMEPRIAKATELDDSAAALRRPGYGVYLTRDGKYVSIGAIEDHFWRSLVEAVDLPQLAVEQYGTFAQRRARWAEVEPPLRARLAELDRDYIVSLPMRHDVPIAPINDIDGPLDDEHFKARGMVWQDESSGSKQVLEWPVALQPFTDRTRMTTVPGLFEHTELLLAELGVAARENDLSHDEDIAQRPVEGRSYAKDRPRLKDS